MDQPDNLLWVQNWYAAQANGDWEHQYGLTIETLDNPGWMVIIELNETSLSDKPFEQIKQDGADPDNDWLLCRVEENKFQGYGDPFKLGKILEVFRSWSESQSPEAR